MKLGMLTQYYPPEMGAPQARLSELAHLFIERGHDVTVLTAMPNYPTGRVFPEYGGWLRRERQHKVRIVRTYIRPSQSANIVPRVASYFSFVGSSALVGSAVLGRLDYLLVESPPLLLGLSGVWLSRRTGARLIFNVSDLWPESAVRLGVISSNGLAHRAGSQLEAWCYRHAWMVSGQSREIVADVAARFPDRCTYHLSNGVDTQRFRPDLPTVEARALLGVGGEGCVALYAGLHGLAQGLDQLLDAAALVGPAVRLVLVGDGPEKAPLVASARERGLHHVSFLDPRPREEMPSLLAAADIVLVPLRMELPGAVPSKLYEAMAAGRALILVAGGEAATIVHEHQTGLVVPPGDIEGVATALQRLAADAALRDRLGCAGRTAAVRTFDRAALGGRFVAHLEQCLAVQ